MNEIASSSEERISPSSDQKNGKDKISSSSGYETHEKVCENANRGHPFTSLPKDTSAYTPETKLAYHETSDFLKSSARNTVWKMVKKDLDTQVTYESMQAIRPEFNSNMKNLVHLHIKHLKSVSNFLSSWAEDLNKRLLQTEDQVIDAQQLHLWKDPLNKMREYLLSEKSWLKKWSNQLLSKTKLEWITNDLKAKLDEMDEFLNSWINIFMKMDKQINLQNKEKKNLRNDLNKMFTTLKQQVSKLNEWAEDLDRTSKDLDELAEDKYISQAYVNELAKLLKEEMSNYHNNTPTPDLKKVLNNAIEDIIKDLKDSSKQDILLKILVIYSDDSKRALSNLLKRPRMREMLRKLLEQVKERINHPNTPTDYSTQMESMNHPNTPTDHSNQMEELKKWESPKLTCKVKVKAREGDQETKEVAEASEGRNIETR